MWTLINLLLTLGKRYIVKQGTLDYFCLLYYFKKNRVQVFFCQKINEQPWVTIF
jgi:hypothetical protein